jgi:hypothetical protein
MSERLPVVSLVDVDDTLLENDRIQNDLEIISNASLALLVGPMFWRALRSSGPWQSWLSELGIRFNFDTVRALADGVLFEFGPSRQQNLAVRDRIRRWGPKLRALSLTRIALLKYRFQLPDFELPEPVRLAAS